ncbi:hypothetical protein SDC9_181403 [bioreactor metagenome]|uniref:Uncharacterized protein n=1 Tax=bioreactor metagenome TaxID=1076179 RepID=A0A645H4G4_9ZZZZ
MPERLLDDRPFPAVGLVGHAVRVQLLDDLFEVLRRDRQVEGVIAVGAVLAIEPIKSLLEPDEGIRVVEGALDEVDAAHQLAPDLGAERRAGVLPNAGGQLLDELLFRPVAAGETDQSEARGERAVIGEVVDGRDELLTREIAGDSEEHEHTRTGQSRQPPVRTVEQRIRPRCVHNTSRSCPSSSRFHEATHGPWGEPTLPVAAAPAAGIQPTADCADRTTAS